jgi:dihydrolipoamide dehydrogenase
MQPTAAQVVPRRTELTIVFSAPGVARVGARLADLNPDAIAIGSADFTRQGRARIAKRNVGLMRLYATQRNRTAPTS